MKENANGAGQKLNVVKRLLNLDCVWNTKTGILEIPKRGYARFARFTIPEEKWGLLVVYS